MTLPLVVPFGCTPITETLYPDSTIAASGWSSSVHSSIDEDGEAEFADVLTAWNDTNTCPTTLIKDFNVGISTPAGTPGGSACQQLTIEVRHRKQTTIGDGEIDVNITLRQTTTLIKTVGYTNDIGTAWATKSYTLSDAEFDSISSFSDLRVEVDWRGCVDAAFNEISANCAYVRLVYASK